MERYQQDVFLFISGSSALTFYYPYITQSGTGSSLDMQFILLVISFGLLEFFWEAVHGLFLGNWSTFHIIFITRALQLLFLVMGQEAFRASEYDVHPSIYVVLNMDECCKNYMLSFWDAYISLVSTYQSQATSDRHSYISFSKTGHFGWCHGIHWEQH